MLHALLCWPDLSAGWPLIGYTDWKDGPHGRFVPVVAPPTLDQNITWAKERKLLEVLSTERAQGRQVWLLATYTNKHPVLERLHSVTTKAGFKSRVLYADRVPTKSRSAWIAKNAPGCDVMISHPLPIATGLTLFDPSGSYNFPSIYWHQSGYDTFAIRQASRRSWRIGQVAPCKVFFSFYRRTLQERAMALVAKKVEASLALEGTFSADGLSALCADGGSLQMELARSLVESIDFGDIERTWAKIQQPAPDVYLPSLALAE